MWKDLYFVLGKFGKDGKDHTKSCSAMVDFGIPRVLGTNFPADVSNIQLHSGTAVASRKVTAAKTKAGERNSEAVAEALAYVRHLG